MTAKIELGRIDFAEGTWRGSPSDLMLVTYVLSGDDISTATVQVAVQATTDLNAGKNAANNALRTFLQGLNQAPLP